MAKDHKGKSDGDGGVVVGRGVAVGVEGGLDDVGGNGAFAADAPEVATEFDNGGWHEGLSFSGIEDERDAVAELTEDFCATGACGRAGDVGASAGKRDANFLDESSNDFTSGPTKSDAASVAGDLERKAHGSVENDGQRAGPESVGETIEIVGEVAGKNVGVMDGADEKRKSFGFGASLDAEDFVDGREIDRIGSEGIERVGRDSDHRTAIKPPSSITDEARIGRIRAKL
jgi:hypothetical protein